MEGLGAGRETAMNTTAQRLAALAQLYQQGQASEMMDRALDKLLAHKAGAARTRHDSREPASKWWRAAS